MPARGTTITLTGEFVDSGGTHVDPDTVELTIFHGDDVVAGPFTDFEDISTGFKTYDWSIPLDAPVGTMHAVWEAILPGDTLPSYGHEDFEVTSFFTAPGFAGCLWPIDTAVLTDEWNALSEELKLRAVALASSSLHSLTGHRVGGCPITVRPMRGQGGCFVPYMGQPGFQPGINSQGRWVNCGQGHPKGPHCEVKLPPPVGRIDEVKVDGEVIPPSDYALQSGRYLVYTGVNDCPWPVTQDLALPDTEEGTFSVTYLNSYPVDGKGSLAVTLLAMEFAKALIPSGRSNCALPKGVTGVVRRGVVFEINPGLFPDGFTGIRVVDAFIQDWNPKGLRSDSVLLISDMNMPRRTR